MNGSLPIYTFPTDFVETWLGFWAHALSLSCRQLLVMESMLCFALHEKVPEPQLNIKSLVFIGSDCCHGRLLALNLIPGLESWCWMGILSFETLVGIIAPDRGTHN